MPPKSIPPQYNIATPVIASYDYTDIQEGTGVVVYYGFSQKDSVSETYVLSDQQFYSYTIEEKAHVIVNGDKFTDGIKAEHNFDLTSFNTPKRVKGTARIQNAMVLSGRDAESSSMYITYRIYHYDGTTETEIGHATTEQLDAASADDVVKPINLPITLTTTHFKKGDTLRLALEVYCSGSGTTTVGDAWICYDPQNRDGAHIVPSTDDTVISRLEVHMPYDLKEV